MKASEMTNEELANFLEGVVNSSLFREPNDKFSEAAARLRAAMILETANKTAIASLDKKSNALRDKLKVAEDALVVCRDGMCGECHRQNPGETCVNGCYEMSMAKNALAEIREEK